MKRFVPAQSARALREGDGVTTFELFFDLVYVFAMTQVTAYMLREHDAVGIARGLIVLALLWWTWVAFAWLGNQARADTGVVRWTMIAAMMAMFIVALCIPEAWDDFEGGLYGPLVLVVAYGVVRVLHIWAYTVAARDDDDDDLLEQVAKLWAPTVGGVTLLLIGVALGGTAQTLLFLAALLVDCGGVYVTSREGEWRIHSAAHWTERHGLFIILAIGESVVAIGVGAAGEPISAPIAIAAALGIASAVSLWWLYFDVVAHAAEHRLEEVGDRERVRIAVDAYSYGHFPIVAGIILAALGVEGVIAHADEREALGMFYASALYGGFAVYLGGHLFFKWRLHGTVSATRLAACAALLLALPLAAMAPPLVALAGMIAIVGVLVAAETRRYAHLRASVPHGIEEPA
jgi:low temperature requirement protein LtrA